MKDTEPAGSVSPLMGMERAFFEEHRDRLCAEYGARVQGLVDRWEATSEAVAALKRKRFLDVRFLAFFGTIAVRVHQGIDRSDRWVSPALTFLGLRPNQRYSPDMERRAAVLAAETLSYERAARVSDATWFTMSDDAVRAVVVRLNDIAQGHPPMGMLPGAASPDDTLVVMADRWNARHRGKNWGRNKSNRNLPERVHWHEIRSAAVWCGRILHDLKHKSPRRLFKTLDELLEEPPSGAPAVLEAIRAQNAYFRSHAAHMDYAHNANQGVPIGSGSVESLCSQFQNRLKRKGQFWTHTGFAALLRITVRHWNGELDPLWPALAA